MLRHPNIIQNLRLQIVSSYRLDPSNSNCEVGMLSESESFGELIFGRSFFNEKRFRDVCENGTVSKYYEQNFQTLIFG